MPRGLIGARWGCVKGKVGVMSLWEVGRGVMGGVTEE